MKQIFASALLAIIFLSCNNSGTKPPKKELAQEIIAVITYPNGIKVVEKVVRVLETDGDTTFYLKRAIPKPKLDSAYLPVKDSTGKVIMTQEDRYFTIAKDSINTKISDVPFDSLVKPAKVIQ